MQKREVKVLNKHGLHARPVAEIVKKANSFVSEISIEKDSVKINGKSFLGLISLTATFNSTLIVYAEGSDEDLAIAALEQIISSTFDEVDD